MIIPLKLIIKFKTKEEYNMLKSKTKERKFQRSSESEWKLYLFERLNQMLDKEKAGSKLYFILANIMHTIQLLSLGFHKKVPKTSPPHQPPSRWSTPGTT